MKYNKFFTFGLPILFFSVLLFSLSKRDKGEIKKLEYGSITESVYGLATVQSKNIFHLRIAVSSVLLNIYVEKGQEVSKNSDLVKFDSFGILKSPISGVVTNLKYESGELVSPQTNVLTIMDLDSKYLSVILEENSAARVKKGQDVKIRFEALGDTLYHGYVESIYPSDGQFETKIECPNLPSSLLPGMTADVSIEVGKKDNILIVPLEGVSNGKIKIKRNGNWQELNIKTGVSNSEYIEIVSPELSNGDEVLIPVKK